MAFKASKDTFVYEQVGPDSFVRRQIFAGQIVQDGLFTDEEGKTPYKDTEVGNPPTPASYPHQLDSNGQLLDEHKPKRTRRVQAETTKAEK